MESIIQSEFIPINLYLTFSRNICQFWPILHNIRNNIGQNWAIYVNIVEHWTKFDIIIHFATISRVIYQFHQECTIYKLFVWPTYLRTCTSPRTSFHSLKRVYSHVPKYFGPFQRDAIVAISASETKFSRLKATVLKT